MVTNLFINIMLFLMPLGNGVAVVTSTPHFDTISRTDGYSGVSSKAGNLYNYTDNLGNFYTMIDGSAIISGKNGYFGTVFCAGNYYNYSDSKGNSCLMNSLTVTGIRDGKSYLGTGYQAGSMYYYTVR